MAIKPDFLKFEKPDISKFEHARSTLVNAAILINSVTHGYVGHRDKEVKTKLQNVIKQIGEVDSELIHDIGLILVSEDKKKNE